MDEYTPLFHTYVITNPFLKPDAGWVDKIGGEPGPEPDLLTMNRMSFPRDRRLKQRPGLV